MPDEQSDLHDQLAREFITKAAKQIIQTGGGYSALMVLVESVMLATMLANRKLFNMPPAVPVGLMEAALQRAIERYTEIRD